MSGAAGTAGAAAPAGSGVDVNTADAAALDAVDGLRGHGPEIVRYREERGRFTALRQLDEVPGLSGKVDAETLARLRTGD